MPHNDFDIGDRVRAVATFIDFTGSVVSPGTVQIIARAPSTPSIGVTPTQVATGVYHGFIDITERGTWAVRVTGTGGLQAASEETFNVKRSEVL